MIAGPPGSEQSGSAPFGPTGNAGPLLRGPAVLPRPRLVTAAGRGALIAVADGGFGKSVLLRDLATALPVPCVLCELDRPTGIDELIAGIVRSARRDGLSDFAAAVSDDDPVGSLRRALGTGEPLSLLVDEIGRLDDAAAAVLAAIAGELRSPARLLLGGRSLPSPLSDLETVRYLGAGDLAFTAAEIAELLGLDVGASPVATIHQLTGGWPAAVAVAATRTAVPGDAGGSGVGSGGAGWTVADWRGAGWSGAGSLGADASLPDSVRALACLPLVDARVVEAVTGEADLGILAAHGIPLIRRQDGWMEISDPLRENIFRASALETRVRRAVAELYARSGQLAAGLALLSGASGITPLPIDPPGMVALLSSVHWTALEQIGLPDVRSAVDAIPDELFAAEPAALISAIRMRENLPVGSERPRWIERALDVFPTGSPAAATVLAESARMAIRLGDTDRAQDLAAQALAAAGNDALIRGRAEFVLGTAAIYRGEATGLREGTEHFTEAIACLGRAGDRRWTAEAHIMLGFGLDYPSGAVPRAVDEVRRAVDLLEKSDAVRASYLTYLAEVLIWLPDLASAEAALDEAQAIVGRTHDQRLTAYVHWSKAWICCARDDLAGCTEHLQAVLRNAGSWFALPSGLAFLGEAAEMCASLSDEPGARQLMRQAREREDAGQQPHLLARAEALIAARFDAPVAAIEALDALAADPDCRPIDRPRLLLLAAWCRHRAGSEDAARQGIRAARGAAEALGLDGAGWMRERDIAAWADEQEGSPAPAPVIEVRLFGALSVVREGVDLTPPPGLPCELVALVAARGAVPVESAIDLLWPEADLSTGRSRLRNLLNRIRSTSGDLIDRRGQELRLAGGVVCDLDGFETAAAAALAAADASRVSLARQALVRAGEPLPAVAAEWAVGIRRRVRRTTIELLDLVADSDWAAGDLDACRRHLREAIELEPHDEVRYVRLAGVLLRQGRRGSAREVVRRAVAAATEIGTPPGADLMALVRTLSTPRAATAPDRPSAAGSVSPR